MTVISLPFPISTNALFADGKTRRHKSQRYADWLQEAGWALKSQRVVPVSGKVTLLYEVQEGHDKRKRDLSNLIKSTEDLLVSHGIIEADDNTIVREIAMKWNKEVTGVRITINAVHSND
jgi:Holliday junction resolvase RusA-like endonuclease